MKILKTSIAGALIACSCLAVADDAEPSYEFTGNVALTTDYVFRGTSQTDNGPAIQGGFDFAHNTGLYAGAWASNVDFGDGDDSNVEIDYYLGFGSEFSGISYAVGGIYYDYPSEGFRDYWEAYGSLGYDFGLASAKVGFNYSDDFFAQTGEATYTSVGVDVPLPYEAKLALGYGYQTIDKGEDYNHYSIGLSRDFFGLGFDVSYHDTDLSDSECGDDNLCDSRFVFTISKSL